MTPENPYILTEKARIQYLAEDIEGIQKTRQEAEKYKIPSSFLNEINYYSDRLSYLKSIKEKNKKQQSK